MRRLRAHRSTDRDGAATAASRPCARHRTDRATRLRRIVKAPANWAFHPCRKIHAQPATHGLTAFATMRGQRCAASPSAIFTAKKILRTSPRKAARRHIGSARRSGNRANRFSSSRKHGRTDRSCKRLTRRGGGLHRVDSRLREALRTPRRTLPCTAAGARSGNNRADVRDRASP
jgi:hypothetical protein